FDLVLLDLLHRSLHTTNLPVPHPPPPSPSTLFFFNDTATTEIYTLSLHDALPISEKMTAPLTDAPLDRTRKPPLITVSAAVPPRSEGTRLNSSHVAISYAVFCLKKKKKSSRGRSRVPQNGDELLVYDAHYADPRRV